MSGRKSVDQFVSISVSESDYKAYIEGRLFGDQRIESIASLNVNSPEERVIFRLRKPVVQSWVEKLIILTRILRLNHLSLVLSPLIAGVLFIFFQQGVFYLSKSLLLFGALICSHAAFFSINDYFDHKNGVDRIDSKGGSQMIQQGYFPAFRLKIVGQAFAVCAAIMGFFAVEIKILILFPLFIFTFFVIFGYVTSGQGLKKMGLGDFVVFLALGPLLSLGISVSLTGDVLRELIIFGIIFGFVSMLALQMKKLENIMVDSKAGINTMVCRLGFDRAKKLICFELIVVSLVFYFSLFFVFGHHSILILLSVILLLYCIKLVQGIYKSSSPLSSFIFTLGTRGVSLHNVVSLFLIVSILTFGL